MTRKFGKTLGLEKSPKRRKQAYELHSAHANCKINASAFLLVGGRVVVISSIEHPSTSLSRVSGRAEYLIFFSNEYRVPDFEYRASFRAQKLLENCFNLSKNQCQDRTKSW